MWLLLCDDERHADKLSRDLLHMWRGRDNQPGEVTTHLLRTIRHPVTGQMALKLPTDFARPISKRLSRVEDMRTAELSRVSDTAGKMRGELEKGAIGTQAVLAMAAGNRIITKEQADADGWFPEPDLIGTSRGRN